MAELKISEIFYSIQGEGTRAGLPCVFVRLQGCMLRCVWCDTDYALEFKGGKKMTVNEIVEEVKSYGCKLVCVTGGEPLGQKAVPELLRELCDEGLEVTLETNGHADIGVVDSRVAKIMDIKCPGSEMLRFNKYENIELLTNRDEVKFVVASREDFDWAMGKVKEYSLIEKTEAVLISPVFGAVGAKELAEWIKKCDLPVRLQMQLHKLIWGKDVRGV